MKKLILVICFVIFASNNAFAALTTVTFDDLPASGNGIPSGYNGLNWVGMMFVQPYPYDDANNGGRLGTVANIQSNSNFDFVGANIFTLIPGSSRTLRVAGFGVNNQLMYDQIVTISDVASAYYTFNYIGINRLLFTPQTGGNPPTLIDNFTFDSNSTTATPTPIPAAAWLLGSGLMGLAGLRRKKA